ncbi:metalloregulator ArsR/SmtB family transcription factor [Primorskyibacter aestuariivivens]|uniref:ArsR/SmtB family transcription factor n=1 Tax=Primorskyibacter aestuariivivens TaxID=1888912 RepID=UPI002300672A|nr:metalloregulator ArsR/SmtB family transcription factor [Primorskyibacter aestuariivivens]MDA7429315.1 metalloregulator ArsR/SmtB family transcription factor [Primorskyibacter aestuariivivens]
MDWEQAAAGFAAMGSEARLQVLRLLIRAGEGGLTVSDLQERSGIAPSTLAHHLKFLSGAGVIVQKKQGRMTINRADYSQLRDLAQFILSECCADEPREAANHG